MLERTAVQGLTVHPDGVALQLPPAQASTMNNQQVLDSDTVLPGERRDQQKPVLRRQLPTPYT